MHKSSLRTRVYIDGYNFYYSCLKGTSFKWLDLVALFQDRILPSVLVPTSEPSTPTLTFEAPAFKFFTAKILEQAAKAPDSVSSQARYHSALRKMYNGQLEIIEGYYAINEATARVIDPKSPKTQAKDCNEAPYWKMEEKQSDVNLALHLYHDSVTKQIDHAVVVTNDTDIAPAMEFVRAHTDVVLGLVVPSRDGNRGPNSALKEQAHWVRRTISSKELQSSELPRVVHGGKQPTTKPISWYPRPDLLAPALELAMSVLGGQGAAFKWLNEPNPYLNGDVPLDLLETEPGAKRVMDYMHSYIAAKGNNDQQA